MLAIVIRLVWAGGILPARFGESFPHYFPGVIMARGLGLLVLIALVGGGAYLFMFKKADTERAVKGYKKAETPQIAADMFKEAIKNREFNMAAFYCTTGYAEQLKRGHEAANKLGTAIDNLAYQMNERKLMRDEVKLVLYALDPFPKEFQVTVGKESGDTAEGTFVFSGPGMSGDTPSSGTWNMKPEIFHVYIRSMKTPKPNTVVAPMKKEAGEWKFDFAADNNLQLRVAYMNDKYMNYVNPMEKVTQEVKNEPETRENATARIKTLMEQAAKE
ncbi:MAG: hypothetical protein C0467_12755 [Planctomycetaceae bacterium]|nr:hypothetical protein [Planctomycetaceae bacterium]